MPRTAIITGASRGLGLALARALAHRGWPLVIDARGAAELDRGRRRAVPPHRASPRSPATSPTTGTATRWSTPPAAAIDLLVNNACSSARARSPSWRDYPLARARSASTRVNVLAPLALAQLALPLIPAGGAIINVTSDAAVEPYEGWGGYGSSKAALEQLTAILAAEQPDLRVYAVDPGDMRTRMHQEAFPGEDISDRPPPEDSVPGLLELIDGELPSGRYQARRARSPTAARADERAGVRAAAPRWRPPSRRRRAASARDAVRLMVADARPTSRSSTRGFDELPRAARRRRPARRQRLGDAAGRGAPAARGRRQRGARAFRHPRAGARRALAGGRAAQRRRLAPGPGPRRRDDRARRRRGELELVAPYASGSRLMLARSTAAAAPSRSCSSATASRSATATCSTPGRCRPTRTSTRSRPAAPRCRAPAGRSRPS